MTQQQTIASPLSAVQLRQWDVDGFLLLQNVIPAAVIASVREMISREVDDVIAQLKAQGLVTDDGKDLPFERRLAVVAGIHANRLGRSWRKGLAKPAVYELHHVTGLVDVIGQLTGTDVIGHPVFNGRPKLPGQQMTVVPWHQDSSYFGADTQQSLIITCWIPLVPVDVSNGCLQVIPGTHRLPVQAHRTESREGQFLELDESLVDESRAVNCLMQPGDVLLFNNLVVHRSLPTQSDTIRWSIDIRYMRDGDNPGHIYWKDPSAKWIIRSQTRPPTPLDEWLHMVSYFDW